eukprot:COSAG02_NODE_34142_length_489_cov_0.651282_2_plen_28_part_01
MQEPVPVDTGGGTGGADGADGNVAKPLD